MRHVRRGFRYQVAERSRDIEAAGANAATAAKIGLIWLVLDTHSGDSEYPVVTTEVTRAKARAVAKRLNQGHQHHDPHHQEHPVRRL